MRSTVGLSLLGLALAALGIVAPIVWDWYKLRTAIEVQHLSTINLVEAAEKLDKLEIRYKGEVIPNISRVTLAIVNTGRTPILDKDFVSPIVISFPKDSRLLDLVVDRRKSDNLEVNCRIEPKNQTTTCRFPLLNPSDYVQVGILLSGPSSPIAAKARIIGVDDVPFIDLSGNKKPEARSVNWFAVVPVAFFSVLLLIGAVNLFFPMFDENKLKAAIKNKTFALPQFAQSADYERYVESDLAFLTSKERQRLKDLSVSLTYPLSAASHDTLQSQTVLTISKTASSLGAMIGALILAFIGVWYVVTAFV